MLAWCVCRYKNSGHVVPFKASVTREPSLSDYIKGGCRVNLLVGIDFTGTATRMPHVLL